MLPRIHIIAGAIFSIILYLFFPQIKLVGALIIFLSSFLIDIDHYLYYVYKKKDFSLRRAYRWFIKNKDLFNRMNKKQKDKFYHGLCFLHGFEAVILLSVAWIFLYPNNLALFIILGFVFHQILDAINLYNARRDYDKILSFIYSVQKSRDKKLLQEI